MKAAKKGKTPIASMGKKGTKVVTGSTSAMKAGKGAGKYGKGGK